MSRTEEFYKPALSGKNIPILPLDSKWHKLMNGLDKTPEMTAMQNELIELLKRQGKLNTESKQLRKRKARLMSEIVSAMDEDNGAKKQNDNKVMIEECNRQLESYQEELLDIPKQINEINYNLMLETMEQCYDAIQENSAEIAEIAEWITAIRIELKKKVVKKQEREIKNQQIYSYMHDIFGAEVIDLFDMRYQPGTEPGLTGKQTENSEYEDGRKRHERNSNNSTNESSGS